MSEENSVLEPSYRRHEKHHKVMCKHCKSTAHSTLEHGKHYKGFHEEKKAERMEKHLKHMKDADGDDDAEGREAGAGEDLKRKHRKGAPSEADAGSMVNYGKSIGAHKLPSLITKHTGSFEGKSNALGHGGRAAQLKARGVPGGVIGKLAREAHAAPGQANYHGHRKAGVHIEPDGGEKASGFDESKKLKHRKAHDGDTAHREERHTPEHGARGFGLEHKRKKA